MRYILISEDTTIEKTSVITVDILDEVKAGNLTIIDTINVMECYYLDNDHQPVWEFILKRD